FRQRSIAGDFNGLAKKLNICSGWQDQQRRKSEIYKILSGIAQGNDAIAQAARQVKADMNMVERHHLNRDFRTIDPTYYEADIHMLHMDIGSNADDFGTFMCCYTKPTTAWARN